MLLNLKFTRCFLHICCNKFQFIFILIVIFVIFCASHVGEVMNNFFKTDFTEKNHYCGEPIDIVYTWVNGSDLVFRENLRKYLENNKHQYPDYSEERFDDKYELKFSLRSLEKYAPWFNHVYIVTNGQIPYWLNLDYDRVTIISHSEIFEDPDNLPTFSSPAIEKNIHKIPGLTEKFIYFNDDIFLGAPVYPDDFVSSSRGYLIYLAWPLPSCMPNCPWIYVGDGQCDASCFHEECQFDGGDCTSPHKREVHHHEDADGEELRSPVDYEYFEEDKRDLEARNLSLALGQRPQHPGQLVKHLEDSVKHLEDSPKHLGEFPKHLEDSPKHLGDSLQQPEHPPKHLEDSEKHLGQLPKHPGNFPQYLELPLKDLEQFPKHLEDVPKHQGESPKHLGEFNKHLGESPKHLGESPKHLGESPKHLGESPKHLGESLKHLEHLPKDPEHLPQLPNHLPQQSKHLPPLPEHLPQLLEPPPQYPDHLPHLPEHPQEQKQPEKNTPQLLGSITISQNPQKRNNKSPNEILTDLLEKQRDAKHFKSYLNAPPHKNVSKLVEEHNKKFLREEKTIRKKRLHKTIHNRRKFYNKVMPANATSNKSRTGAQASLDTFALSLQHTHRLFNMAYEYRARKVPAHSPILIDKEIMFSLQNKFAKHFRTTESNKLRSANDIQYAFSYYYFVMNEKQRNNISDMFDYFDTDKSGTWSDREIRTILTRINDLPLNFAMVEHFDQAILNCSKYVKPPVTDVNVPSFERYLDSKLPLVTKKLILNCPQIINTLNANFGSAQKYKYEVIKNAQSNYVMFKMLSSNISDVVGHLDEIRKTPRKFVCLNDNMSAKRKEDNEMVKAILFDFYQSLFPKASRFELPREFRNRFVYVEDLRQWKSYHMKLKFIVIALIVVLSLLILCHNCKRRLLRRIKRFIYF